MKAMLGLMLIFSFSLGASECLHQTQERLCVSLEWIEGPFLNAYSKNIVSFQNVDTKELKSPSVPVKFFGWMKMGTHEHGTKPVQTSLIKEGVYQNAQIYFMGGMMGTWEFKVKVGDEEIVLFTMNT
jgi:hypothetical protein